MLPPASSQPPDRASTVLLTHRQYLFLRHDLATLPEFAPQRVGFTFERATVAIADELRDFEDEVFTREDVRRKIALGDRLYVIRGEGEVAWFGWARTGRFLHTPIDLWCQVNEQCADIFGIYTKPRLRRLGLAKWGYSQMLAALRQDGCRRAYVQVETWNIPSRRAIQSCGFVPYLRLRVWRAGRRKLFAVRTFSNGARSESRQLYLRHSAHLDQQLSELLYPSD